MRQRPGVGRSIHATGLWLGDPAFSGQLNSASHRDPEVGLAAVAALRQMLEQLEALQVKAAREDGWTWERIADALGVTRQSVHRKYASRRFPGRRRT